MPDFTNLLYETPAQYVARIVLNRPDTRNAQDTHLLYELNEAFNIAARDDAIKVIILSAKGPHFSSGHDLREPNAQQAMHEYQTVGTWCGFTWHKATLRQQGGPPTSSWPQPPTTPKCTVAWPVC